MNTVPERHLTGELWQLAVTELHRHSGDESLVGGSGRPATPLPYSKLNTAWTTTPVLATKYSRPENALCGVYGGTWWASTRLDLPNLAALQPLPRFSAIRCASRTARRECLNSSDDRFRVQSI
jgi:hypothetical protein